MPDRYSVVVTRDGGLDGDIDVVVLGPFRRRERAEARAATVRRLAAKYDDPDGHICVAVEPIRSGSLAAQEAMDWLYGSLVPASEREEN